MFANLRNRSLLRRGVVALESIAESLALLARVEADKFSHVALPPRKVEYGTLDVAESERQWRESQSAEEMERE